MKKDEFAFTTQTDAQAFTLETANMLIGESRMIAGYSKPEIAKLAALSAGVKDPVIWVKGNTVWYRW